MAIFTSAIGRGMPVGGVYFAFLLFFFFFFYSNDSIVIIMIYNDNYMMIFSFKSMQTVGDPAKLDCKTQFAYL